MIDLGKQFWQKKKKARGTLGSMTSATLGYRGGPGASEGFLKYYSWASLVAQLVKSPPATRETWVRSMDQEDPLEKGTAAHSSILAWRIPWTV